MSFAFLIILFAILRLADVSLTAIAVLQWGVEVEANPVWRLLMSYSVFGGLAINLVFSAVIGLVFYNLKCKSAFIIANIVFTVVVINNLYQIFGS